jgi:hypothetical protein
MIFWKIYNTIVSPFNNPEMNTRLLIGILCQNFEK